VKKRSFTVEINWRYFVNKQDNARVADEFMNQIEPIAAYVPYMTCPGNHEWLYNFSNYVYRFSMPNSEDGSIGGDNNHFFSVNIGPIHLISFSTEFYYFFEFGFLQVLNQYKWIEADLIVARFLFYIQFSFGF
jgi:hypothetical protein